MYFRDKVIQWYSENKRNLPWRNTKVPYQIWVSEIILQQTRIDQGLPYFNRFIDTFPDVRSLAEATEQEVLYIWKGLGYYTRARNMHYTAQDVVTNQNGVFPSKYDELIKLKGIGSYTAAAIASICSDEVKPAVDGNVIRVLSRYFGLTEAAGSSALLKKVRWISNQLIPPVNPGDYNQAMMEYGALICTPVSPECAECELSKSCFSFKNGMTAQLPTKKKTIVKTIRYFNYIHLVTNSGEIVIRKRDDNDIWRNLWDFPLLENSSLLGPENIVPFVEKLLNDGTELKFNGYHDTSHILSHQTLYVRFFTFRINEASDLVPDNPYITVHPESSTYPFPRLIENFLKRNDIFFGYD